MISSRALIHLVRSLTVLSCCQILLQHKKQTCFFVTGHSKISISSCNAPYACSSLSGKYLTWPYFVQNMNSPLSATFSLIATLFFLSLFIGTISVGRASCNKANTCSDIAGEICSFIINFHLYNLMNNMNCHNHS